MYLYRRQDICPGLKNRLSKLPKFCGSLFCFNATVNEQICLIFISYRHFRKLFLNSIFKVNQLTFGNSEKFNQKNISNPKLNKYLHAKK